MPSLAQTIASTAPLELKIKNRVRDLRRSRSGEELGEGALQ